ncbi:unnamed protein product [Camellia sinensis]
MNWGKSCEKASGRWTVQTFFKERELSGDIIAKVSDIFWLRKVIRLDDAEDNITQQSKETLGDEDEGGFLKLTRTREWIAGNNSAPVNKKMIAKQLQNDSEKRKIMNLLSYEALKREMMLLTVGIGIVCSGYCLVTLSVQAAVSYAAGVLFSCLYLQLLYKQVDNLSRETVPQIFRQKKSKEVSGPLVMRPNHGDEYTVLELNPMEWTFDNCPKILVPVADGTEEMEDETPVDEEAMVEIQRERWRDHGLAQ